MILPDIPPTTEDIFQRGRFTLIQPSQGAHRAGLDALLLASTLPRNFKGNVLDLGAGAGAIGFALAANNPMAQVTLIENNSLMLNCATLGLAHHDNAGFANRVTIVNANILAGMRELELTGLKQNSFDALLTNPPYNLDDMQPSAHGTRAKAHQAEGDIFEQWLRVAVGLLKPKGQLSLIARAQASTLILNALDRRFGHINITPIHAHQAQPAIRMIITAIKGSRAGLSIMSGLVLHDHKTRAYRPEIDQLLNGQLRLTDL